jgi:predicted AAA+ superfamily ATPase
MTGSQQFKVMKNARESLAGRVGILRLQGLSKAETEGRISPNPFVPSMNPERWRNLLNWGIRDVYAAIVRGGYPECHSIPSLRVRHYFASYIDTYIERDIREMIDITNIGTFRTFMRVCAARTGQLLNYADLARDVGISTPTARAWLSMLETSGVIYLLHPYYNNLIKRAVKTPKLYFTDTGLCSHLLGITSAEAAIDSPLSGALLETYVLMDIFKSHWYAGSDAQFWFFRDGDQREVDLILDYEGRLHPIEIKRAASIKPGDIRLGFSAFHAAVGNRAATGSVVLIGDSFGALDAETALIPVGAL